ncbi:MAG: hypothetical protein SWC40_05145 [Thermodesulfobacteriota bacterium]|nr:hypothetical protein [Thermodesulfobacteriota bacterium]
MPHCRSGALAAIGVAGYKQCGELTSMAFAARLAKRDISLEACPPLFTPEYESNRKALEAILKGAAA